MAGSRVKQQRNGSLLCFSLSNERRKKAVVLLILWFTIAHCIGGRSIAAHFNIKWAVRLLSPHYL